jgi:hypothetical protein
MGGIEGMHRAYRWGYNKDMLYCQREAERSCEAENPEGVRKETSVPDPALIRVETGLLLRSLVGLLPHRFVSPARQVLAAPAGRAAR